MNFNEQLNVYAKLIDDRLKEVFAPQNCLQRSVYDAMAYSVLAGGKRLRPILVLAASDLFDGNLEDAIRFAVAVECIHTYSLIHDDLPCMDNDDLRRGRPTCHRQFDEATALLAGDGLLTFAFEYMTDLTKYKSTTPDAVLRIVNEIAKGSGCDGMIGGQVVDLENEGKSGVSEEVLTYMHNRKTGALIRVSVLAGAISAGADQEQLAALVRFAENIGLAFQIQDDILDVTGNAEVLGKPTGSDAGNEKTTYVTLLGIDAARERVEALTNEAISELEIFGEKGSFLRKLAEFLTKREK